MGCPQKATHLLPHGPLSLSLSVLFLYFLPVTLLHMYSIRGDRCCLPVNMPMHLLAFTRTHTWTCTTPQVCAIEIDILATTKKLYVLDRPLVHTDTQYKDSDIILWITGVPVHLCPSTPELFSMLRDHLLKVRERCGSITIGKNKPQ